MMKSEPTNEWKIKLGGLSDPRVIALLDTHVKRARAETAPCSAHAMDHEQLGAADVSFWTLCSGEEPIAVGAVKRLSPDHGEVKSMHTAEHARRSGAGSAMLRHLIEVAKAGGMTRLSLETGSAPYFAPARAFYQRHGFAECPPFGDYGDDPNSVFMTLTLS
jgi:putative acetyltransferase